MSFWQKLFGRAKLDGLVKKEKELTEEPEHDIQAFPVEDLIDHKLLDKNKESKPANKDSPL